MDFLVNRKDLRQCRFVAEASGATDVAR